MKPAANTQTESPHNTGDPNLEIRITRLSAYDDFFLDPAIGAYEPWFGIQLEITNHGTEKVTLRSFQAVTEYKPLNKSATAVEWYVSGTRRRASILPLGTRSVFPIDQKEVVSTHLAVALNIGETGLSNSETDDYSARLASVGKLSELLGKLYVIAKDSEGRTYKSHEFFGQGPEVMMAWQRCPKPSLEDPRAKTEITYIPIGDADVQNVAMFTERDVFRDGSTELVDRARYKCK